MLFLLTDIEKLFWETMSFQMHMFYTAPNMTFTNFDDE